MLTKNVSHSTTILGAHVEFALSWIVGHEFSKANYNLAVTGFLSIENFRSKLQYADTVVQRREMPANEKANWAKLVDRAGKAATKRNNLAHRWVITVPDGKPGRRALLLESRPALNPPKDTRNRYAGAICLRDVAGYQLEFVALMCALENFQCRLVGQPERLPKSQEQAQRPPTLAKLRREIYAFAQRPPRPSRK